MTEKGKFDGIVRQIVELCSPERIILFGSNAKGTAREHSDIDLCVVMDADDKRRALTDMYFSIDSDKPIDFLLYTPGEWESCAADPDSFAYRIKTEGVVLYGRQ